MMPPKAHGAAEGKRQGYGLSASAQKAFVTWSSLPVIAPAAMDKSIIPTQITFNMPPGLPDKIFPIANFVLICHNKHNI